MGGGYAIPEFGLAYVRNMRFFSSKSEKKHRITDMMVSACYCLNGSELYANPKNKSEVTTKILLSIYEYKFYFSGKQII
jgi:hypothetical protein